MNHALAYILTAAPHTTGVQAIKGDIIHSLLWKALQSDQCKDEGSQEVSASDN